MSGVGGGGRGGEGVLPEGSPGCFTFLLLSRAKYANNRIGSVAACGEHAAWSYLHLPREGQRQGRQGGGGPVASLKLLPQSVYANLWLNVNAILW